MNLFKVSGGGAAFYVYTLGWGEAAEFFYDVMGTKYSQTAEPETIELIASDKEDETTPYSKPLPFFIDENYAEIEKKGGQQ